MAGRYGYATFNTEMDRRNTEQRRVPPPLSTASLIQGLQQGNLHNRLMQRNPNSAHLARLLKESKNSENARNAKKAKKGANNALKALKQAQRKAFGVNQNSSAGTTRKGKKKEMTAKKMKKKQKIHEIKKAAIAAMQRQQANNARNKERAVAANIGNLNMGGGPIVGPGLELIGSSASKANSLPSAPNYNSNSNPLPSAPNYNSNSNRALIASLPIAPTHNVARKTSNNKKNKNNKRRVAVAMGGRRKTRKHKKHKRRKHKKRKTHKHKKRRKRKTRRRRSRQNNAQKGGALCHTKCVPGITNCGDGKECSLKPGFGVSCPFTVGPGWCADK